MGKIDSLGANFFKDSSRKKVKKKKKGGRTGSFSSILESSAADGQNTSSFFAVDNLASDNLELLLDDLYEAAEKLKKSATLESIHNYKNTVKAFLQHIMRRMLKVEQKMSGANIQKRRIFYVVKTIDKKLESLVVTMLRGHAEQLKLLEKIDEINGLIVDLIS